MKLIYVCSGDSSVFESQVLELLQFHIEKFNMDVLLIQGFLNEKEKKNITKKISNYLKIETIWVRNYPVYPIFRKKMIKNYTKGILKATDLENAIIHVRGDYMGAIIKQILVKNNLFCPLLVDSRGLILEELKYKMKTQSVLAKLKSVIQLLYIKNMQRELLKHKNGHVMWISSVSEGINENLKLLTKPNSNIEFLCHPNIAGKKFVYDEKDRIEIRKRYNFKKDDKIAIMVTGGNSVWQKDIETLSNLITKGFKIINLSKVDPKIEGCITMFVPFEEVPRILSAADIGLLFREKVLLNFVASPSKLSEFAKMGLYIFHNKSVNIACDYIENSKNGLLIESKVDLLKIDHSEIDLNNRELRIEKGTKYFGVESIGASYIKAYEQMLIARNKTELI